MRSPQIKTTELSQGGRDSLLDDECRLASLAHEPARGRIWPFALFTLILICSFSQSLYALTRFAVNSELYSHIILIPFISFYFVWLKRYQLPIDFTPSRKLAVIPFAVAAGIVTFGFLLRAPGRMQTLDYLATMTLAPIIFLWGGCLFFFGLTVFRVVTFPLLFLIFAVPFPDSLQQQLQTFLQVSSAAAAHLFFQISGTAVLRQGTAFQLPGFSFEVAPECSGIHSSLVLFITSLLAGHLLLRKLWSKTLFACFVIPLAIIRNGFRILVIGELCVHVSPEMINSYIHRRGGPLFFAGSLIPFFLLLLLLRRIESRPSSPLEDKS